MDFVIGARLASLVNLSEQEKFKIAWCMFSYYNTMWRGWTATHRLHECMAAADLYMDTAALGYTPSITTLPS